MPAPTLAPSEPELPELGVDAEEERREYEREQLVIAAAERKKEREEQLAKAKEAIDRARVEAALAAATARANARDNDDDDDRAETRKRQFLMVAASIGLLVVGYFGWQSFKPPFKPPVMAADSIWKDYSSDPEAADRKYAKQRHIVVGKVQLQRGATRNAPAQVYFQPPAEEGKIRIHCVNFLQPEDLREIQHGAAFEISGEFQPYKQGNIVEMKDCVLRAQVASQSAVRRGGETQPHLACAARPHAVPAALPKLLALLSWSSPNPHSRSLPMSPVTLAMSDMASVLRSCPSSVSLFQEEHL
jgi:hypothetical protein